MDTSTRGRDHQRPKHRARGHHPVLAAVARPAARLAAL